VCSVAGDCSCEHCGHVCAFGDREETPTVMDGDRGLETRWTNLCRRTWVYLMLDHTGYQRRIRYERAFWGKPVKDEGAQCGQQKM
jgi:hypothetical protein